MKTVGTLFSGGELFGIGARNAGYEHIWGIEKEDKIAEVARQNGFWVQTGDVRHVEFSELRRPDHLHASPPCPNFSRAKQGAVETPLDLELSDAVCRALVEFTPPTFTLENVVGYRDSESFKRIGKCLQDLGYWWDATNINFADFGVPQTRIRLIVRASRGLLMGYPPPVKWKGWYKAIEDLIPSLPDAKFAPWQLKRLPQEYKDFMIGNSERSAALEADEPAQTITANRNQGYMRAFLVGDQNRQLSLDEDPSFTVRAGETGGAAPRAFIFSGAGNTNMEEAEPGKGVRYEDEPVQTIGADGGGRTMKAFVMNVQGEGGDGHRDEDEPHNTATASMDRTPSRAFVVDGQPNAYGESVTVRSGEDPIYTVQSSGEKKPARAYANGRIIKLDIRCLGRFQTVPDDYKGLTIKINGNGFPCLGAQKILETLE